MGDGTGRVIALGERECSLQRRQQKIVEITPSPSLSPSMREQLQGKPTPPLRRTLFPLALLLRLPLSSSRCSCSRRSSPHVNRPPPLLPLHRRISREGKRVLVHRGQPPPASGAHRHGSRHRLGLGDAAGTCARLCVCHTASCNTPPLQQPFPSSPPPCSCSLLSSASHSPTPKWLMSLPPLPPPPAAAPSKRACRSSASSTPAQSPSLPLAAAFPSSTCLQGPG